LPFSQALVPMVLSILISLSGLAAGWLVYRHYEAGQADPLAKALGVVHTWLKNKWYFDEIYHALFVRPSAWFSETFTYKWMDRGVIDGILHTVARLAFGIGPILRNYFDKPVVNEFIGDGSASVVQWFGRRLRLVQTGQVQFYMMTALVIAIGVLLAVIALP